MTRKAGGGERFDCGRGGAGSSGDSQVYIRVVCGRRRKAWSSGTSSGTRRRDKRQAPRRRSCLWCVSEDAQRVTLPLRAGHEALRLGLLACQGASRMGRSVRGPVGNMEIHFLVIRSMRAAGIRAAWNSVLVWIRVGVCVPRPAGTGAAVERRAGCCCVEREVLEFGISARFEAGGV